MILTLRQQHKQVNYVCFGEGGELAISLEVNRLLIDMTAIMHITGGFVSHFNKDKRSHQTINDMV